MIFTTYILALSISAVTASVQHPKFTLITVPDVSKIYERSEYAPLTWSIDRDLTNSSSSYIAELDLVYERSKRVQNYGSSINMLAKQYAPQLADVDMYIGCNKCRFELNVFYYSDPQNPLQRENVAKLSTGLFSVRPAVTNLVPRFELVDLLPPVTNFKRGQELFAFKLSVSPATFDIATLRYTGEVHLFNLTDKTFKRQGFVTIQSLGGTVNLNDNFDPRYGCNLCLFEVRIFERNETTGENIRLLQTLQTNTFHVAPAPPSFKLVSGPLAGQTFNASITSTIPFEWSFGLPGNDYMGDWFKASTFFFDEDTNRNSSSTNFTFRIDQKKVNITIPTAVAKRGCQKCRVEFVIIYSRPPLGLDSYITLLNSETFKILPTNPGCRLNGTVSLLECSSADGGSSVQTVTLLFALLAMLLSLL